MWTNFRQILTKTRQILTNYRQILTNIRQILTRTDEYIAAHLCKLLQPIRLTNIDLAGYVDTRLPSTVQH